MRGKMSPEQYEAFKILREGGGLIPIDDTYFPEGGWVISGCEDGDRTPELVDHFRMRLIKRFDADVTTQLVLIVGGPAAGAPQCPFHHLTYKGKNVTEGGDQLLFARTEKAFMAKPGIRNFGHMPHCVCGMCDLSGVSLWDNFAYSYECKDLVRKEFPQLKYHAVIPHFDLIGYPEAEEDDGRKGAFRSYYLNRRKFETLAQQRTSQHSSKVA